jgi:threonylcarbamoyladenosine tRNA methylthiotransferase MtaB
MHDQAETKTTFAVTTLGCKVNQADTDAITDQMNLAGFEQRDFNATADVYIVNTCTVTHMGDRSSRNLISQAHRRHPTAFLVVTGCYAEMNPTAVAALPGVDLVVGNRGKDILVDTIKEQYQTNKQQQLPLQDLADSQSQISEELRKNQALVVDGVRTLPLLPLDTQHIGSDSELAIDATEEEPQSDNPARLSPFTSPAHTTLPSSLSASAKLQSRTRVQMKVQDGCDNRCTYCIVPYVRGGSRSRSIASVVEHVQRKARAGFQEIVLTGIHLGDYHPEGDEKRDLGDLITALLHETDMPRIRVSSLEPEDFRLEWLELWQNSRLCRHFHLPMQSGSDAILRRMARRYTSSRYHTIITTAKQLIPGVAISTDIITGFPGESDDDFEQTYQLASTLQFAKAHIFRFSPRQGTAAARMKGQIKEEIKKARSARLLTLNEEHSRLFRQQFSGLTTQVLIEGYKHGYWEGLTDNYLRVEVDGLPEAETRNWQNTLVRVRLSHLVDDGIAGIVVE